MQEEMGSDAMVAMGREEEMSSMGDIQNREKKDGINSILRIPCMSLMQLECGMEREDEKEGREGKRR